MFWSLCLYYPGQGVNVVPIQTVVTQGGYPMAPPAYNQDDQPVQFEQLPVPAYQQQPYKA